MQLSYAGPVKPDVKKVLSFPITDFGDDFVFLKDTKKELTLFFFLLGFAYTHSLWRDMYGK